jgi:CRP/FNR family transcriptional regulator
MMLFYASEWQESEQKMRNLVHLASNIGTTYETAFRAMSELIQEAAITVSGKRVAVTDTVKLQGYVQLQ